MKIPSVEKEESKQEINNNLLISGPMKIDNIETPKSSLLTNSLTVENEFNSNTSNQNQVSILEANNLEDNSLIKQKNYLINLLFFVFGGFFFLIIPKFIKNKKDLLRKSSTKKGETNEKYLSQEFHSLNKLISQKTEHMNNLYLEKEIIENQIESIKYDLKYHEIQKTNLKVYTLTKYKELFPSQLDGIENMKFNGLVSNNINNTYSISKYNPYDMKSYKFIKNT
tara:strand:- start:568 stop:1242 length:675 start_codon:yes stop_codon:yes gene_type:complete